MRRFGLALAGCLLAQLIAPPPAQAWWGWWDELSGAGPFRGWEVETRLFCFGDRRGPTDALLEAAAKQLTFAYELARANPDANSKYGDRLAELTASSMPAVSRSVTGQKLQDLGGKTKELTDELARVKSQTPVEKTVARTLEEVANAYERAGEVRLLGASAGVTLSACPIQRDVYRRGSINMTFRRLESYSSRQDQYAGGNQVVLTTFVPAVAWRPMLGIGPDWADFFDLASGAGVYWLTSDGSKPGGFDTISGILLEPVRIDFHAPSVVTSRPRWYWALLGGLSYRRGWAIFPAGFEANAFGVTQTPQQGERIPAEWVRNKAIYLDLGPLIHRLAMNKENREAGGSRGTRDPVSK